MPVIHLRVQLESAADVEGRSANTAWCSYTGLCSDTGWCSDTA